MGTQHDLIHSISQAFKSPTMVIPQTERGKGQVHKASHEQRSRSFGKKVRSLITISRSILQRYTCLPARMHDT